MAVLTGSGRGTSLTVSFSMLFFKSQSVSLQVTLAMFVTFMTSGTLSLTREVMLIETLVPLPINPIVQTPFAAS